MKKYALDNTAEEVPLGSTLYNWHQRTVSLRIKAVMYDGLLDDNHTAKLVKMSRLLTLIHLN